MGTKNHAFRVLNAGQGYIGLLLDKNYSPAVADVNVPDAWKMKSISEGKGKFKLLQGITGKYCSMSKGALSCTETSEKATIFNFKTIDKNAVPPPKGRAFFKSKEEPI